MKPGPSHFFSARFSLGGTVVHLIIAVVVGLFVGGITISLIGLHYIGRFFEALVGIKR